MKRFFFHIGGALTFRDIFGTMLASAEAARAHGLRRWRDLKRSHPNKDVVVVVADEDDREITSIREDGGERMQG